MVIYQNKTNQTVWLEPRTEDGDALVLDDVIEDIVYIRAIDPCDGPPERVRVDPGQKVIGTTPIGAVGLHASDEVGADDLLFPLRVVPAGRTDGIVYGRTLRLAEIDDGRRVHVRPGERFTLARGALRVELDAIDDFYRGIDPDRPEGSLATSIRVWFSIGQNESEALTRIALAAAHRLDAANHLLRLAGAIRASLGEESNLSGPQLVSKIDEVVHLVQLGVISVARCIALIDEGIRTCSHAVLRPTAISSYGPTIKALRDSYEHIEERAHNRVDAKGTLDERASMIFDHRPLLAGRIDYMDLHLELDDLNDVTDACRTAIKLLVGGPVADGAANEA